MFYRAWILAVLFLVVMVTVGDKTDWLDMQIPAEHIPFFFRNNPNIRQRCAEDRNCPYKNYLHVERCWGYEDTCEVDERMSMPHCTEDTSRRKRQTMAELSEIFWRQVDFGYVLERRENLVTLCTSQHKEDSSLQCTDGLRYCRAVNVLLDLRTADIHKHSDRYRTDTLKDGEIGGHCKLDLAGLRNQRAGHLGALSSWTNEIQHFKSLSSRPLTTGKCDVIIEKPTFIIKLDSGGSMYHHFCDFVNLYVSQHVNNTFSTDVNILMWHPVGYDYVDLFKETWKVFTKNPILMLKEFDGKRVCFRQAVFSFLARMYYAVRPIENCYGSAMMRAFSQHTLHRLGITQDGPLKNKIRVTFLSRGTKYRRIRNEDQIISTLKSQNIFDVKKVDFNRQMPFLDQLKISHNTDIFIGIHGAGLTHLLFLPDWAVVFEIYNCEDVLCYLNLARIRGVKYITWENPDALQTVEVDDTHKDGARAKFVDYIIDDKETLRLVTQAVDHVTGHHAFIASRDIKYGKPKIEL